MKLINLLESLDDTKNLEIQNKTKNFYFETREGLNCHANFNWRNPIKLGLINVNGVVELPDGKIPSNLFSQVMLGAVDYIKTLNLDSSDIDELEIRIGAILIKYMNIEIRMDEILTQREKIHYSKRFNLSNLMNPEIVDVFEMNREFPQFSEGIDEKISVLKNKTKNVYRAMKKGKVREYMYELPDNPKIEVKLSMDNVRKDSLVIEPEVIPYVYLDKESIKMLNNLEDTDDTTLDFNFYYELMLKFRKFKIKLIISE